MAYDEALAQHFRFRLEGMDGVSEKKMMGGICFFLNGNMIGGADRAKSGEGRFMFRVGKENDIAAKALPGAEPMMQGGRRMTGLFFVDEEVASDEVFATWLAMALEHAAKLPEKR